MKKTSDHPMFPSISSNSSLRYRRKAPVSTNKEKQHLTATKQEKSKQLKQEVLRGERPLVDYRYQPKSRYPKQQQQPVLLKQMLWKAKAVQPTPLPLMRQSSKCNEDKEVAFVNGVETLARTKKKTVGVLEDPLSSEPFVAGLSSQETQSGSEDDVVFLRYSELRQREDAEEIDRENWPGMPSEEDVVTKQGGLEKAAATRRKQRQKYRLKQKQKRAAVKKHKRLQHQEKQENERLHTTKEDTGSITQDGENATEGNLYSFTNRRSEMNAGFSQLKEEVQVIVVGDVACPVVADSGNQLGGTAASTSDQSMASITGFEVAIVDFRQHASTMLDRSKEIQVQYRDSFVVENSDFDAASSYDFFKRRFCEIQRTTGIVYY
ncbi:unnamed protein product [Peronospora effusa]|uniref:Uncharacterized protein n=1 Tax=Peronospora effusa TaxID=542832 RepID=A0A425CA00_9STRA|nr:hypothetical protein DD237_007585 [Peronospora effusa]CAI5705864.1 unnamed protein product [Peronospora effusa]